jgi:hypothetical protein
MRMGQARHSESVGANGFSGGMSTKLPIILCGVLLLITLVSMTLQTVSAVTNDGGQQQSDGHAGSGSVSPDLASYRCPHFWLRTSGCGRGHSG